MRQINSVAHMLKMYTSGGMDSFSCPAVDVVALCGQLLDAYEQADTLGKRDEWSGLFLDQAKALQRYANDNASSPAGESVSNSARLYMKLASEHMEALSLEDDDLALQSSLQQVIDALRRFADQQNAWATITCHMQNATSLLEKENKSIYDHTLQTQPRNDTHGPEKQLW